MHGVITLTCSSRKENSVSTFAGLSAPGIIVIVAVVAVVYYLGQIVWTGRRR